ncbi:MAG: methyltransferase [Candidatus Woesearchaeota archaeon]
MVEHYYTEEQTSPFKPTKVMMTVGGVQLELYTAGGVFSPKQLDSGTKLLIESAIIEKGWEVLDLGCGYGIAGIALKKRYPSINIIMSDVNKRAVKLARMNAELHKIKSEIIQSSIFSSPKFEGRSFDTIILNPPQTAGKQICFDMIEQSFQHLKKGGMLQIVARHQKGGKHLSQKMEEIFGNVEDIAKRSGFRVYVSKREK